MLADGPCTDLGELALGRNVLVAFMPWRGYNFEDAILVSEKLVKEDYYTSIHIEEFEIEARDTKLGPEEITRDIPNIAESVPAQPGRERHHPHRRHGEAGRHPGGQGHAQGRNAAHAGREAAARHLRRKGRRREGRFALLPAGHRGRRGRLQDLLPQGRGAGRALQAHPGRRRSQRLHRNLEDEKRILTDERAKRLAALLEGKELLADLHDEKTNKRLLAKGAELTRDVHREDAQARDLKRMRFKDKDPRLNEQIDEIEEMTSRQIAVLEKITEEKIAKLQKGDELPPGVIKLVKVYIAMKRKLSVGDKMAGRHGNKGVIARIVPEEDMPYLPDGTPVEIVLNPLGVPSRMNVGQILETHLGWAGHKRWACSSPRRCSTAPPKREIKKQLAEAELPDLRQSRRCTTA